MYFFLKLGLIYDKTIRVSYTTKLGFRISIYANIVLQSKGRLF